MHFIDLDAERVYQIHEDILSESAGLSGICPDKSLESALHRVINHAVYDDLHDLFEIAALYGESIAQGHIFNDANKRTSLISMYVFLELNGYILNISDDEAADTMVMIAEKQITRKKIAEWLENNSQPIIEETDL